ncbi:MAG: NAD-dependent epimerase/dehydratase family protein, partial [Bacteroidia bacterium]|nr:NAD-dependent epimerase/dehydratase family protein [Bacteroidia bacterium]
EYLSRFGVTKDSVEIWGTGKPKREFLWSEDMADACVFIMENRDFTDTFKKDHEIRNTHINIGTGKEISIKDLAETIKSIVGFKGNLVFNSKKPDGTLRKLTDVSKLHRLGWKHTVELTDGIRKIYDWYVDKK